MAITFDKEFQKQIIKDCADEVFSVKKPKPEDIKKVVEIMKKYENKVYEKYIQRVPVAKIDKKNEKEELINSSIRHQFTGDAGFLTDYNRLLRGYQEETEFNPQQLPYEVKMPKDLNTYYPKNPFPNDKKSYIDTQANSKFYFPQDYQPHYDKKAFYTNKPSADISNQQHLFVAGHEGMFDPYSSQPQGFGSSIGAHGFRSQAGLAVSQQNPQHPSPFEDDTNLRRTIEMLGGIQRTVPNMERSLYDNEIKNIERNYRVHNQLDNTSNGRLNSLLQNQMTQVFSPQFDTPGARAASPQRGGIPALQKPGLYYSPSKGDSGLQTGQMPPPSFMPEMSLTRDGLAERNLNSVYQPIFTSSRSLREGKQDLLNPRAQYDIPGNL